MIVLEKRKLGKKRVVTKESKWNENVESEEH